LRAQRAAEGLWAGAGSCGGRGRQLRVGGCCAARGMWGEGSRGDGWCGCGCRGLGGLAAPRLVGAAWGAIPGDEHAESECSWLLHLTV
jgi:hypothetical protein